jgi:hypothetical protein
MTWTRTELETIGSVTEIEIAPARADGTAGTYRPIWVVRVGDDLYVRSFRGTDGRWYRSASQRGAAQVRADGTEHRVRLDRADDVDRSVIDDAYRAKYGRSSYVDVMVTPDAAATTLRLVAR